MGLDIARKNLDDFKEVADKHNLTFWLDAGTLLFVIRDGILKEDDWEDQDVGIYQEDFEKYQGLIPKFQERGFSSHLLEHPCQLGQEGRLTRDGCHIDIFVKAKRDGRRWWLSYPEKGYIPHHIDASHLDKLWRVKWRGQWWNIPSRVEKYLTDTYGDWQTPVSAWNWETDPKCIDRNWEIR